MYVARSLVAILLLASAAAAEEPPSVSALKADRCRARAVAILKKMQREDGSWEPREDADALPHHWKPPAPGLTTSLAVLALLESGVPADDPCVKKGLAGLREANLLNTELVAVQTLALCRAGQKRDQKLIQRNVDWLCDGAVRTNKVLQGWGETNNPKGKSDNWSTQYAVAALHAAVQAGAKVDNQWWKDIRSYYLQTQLPDGSWGFSPPIRHSFEMTTLSGICGLLITDENLGACTDASKSAVQRGLARLEKGFDEQRLSALSRLGGYTGRLAIVRFVAPLETNLISRGGKNLDPFRTELASVVRAQNPDGSFSFSWNEKDPAVATSYALLFLAAGK
jgi:hypothetical protein